MYPVQLNTEKSFENSLDQLKTDDLVGDFLPNVIDLNRTQPQATESFENNNENSIPSFNEKRKTLCKAVAFLKGEENHQRQQLEREYKSLRQKWKVFVQKAEEENYQEFQIRTQIINSAIQEDFAYAQANYNTSFSHQSRQTASVQYRTSNSGQNAFYRSSTDSRSSASTSNQNAAYLSGLQAGISYSRRRGQLSDVVRSEEEMNIVLRNLIEQERQTLGSRWMNTLVAIPEMPICNEYHTGLKFLNGNNICSYGELRRCSIIEFNTVKSWSKDEIKTFVEKYYLYPKLFGKIASYLPKRTASECVKFYYCFKKTLQLKKCPKLSAALANVSQFTAGASISESLVSPLFNALNAHNYVPKFTDSVITSDKSIASRKSRRREETNGHLEDAPEMLDDLFTEWSDELHEKLLEGVRLFGNNFSLVAEYLNYSKNPDECKEYFRVVCKKSPEFTSTDSTKRLKQTNSIALSRQSAQNNEENPTREAPTHNISGPSKSISLKKPQFSHYWTKDEKRKFSQFLLKYGKDWETIAANLKTKSSNQVKKYYKKNRALIEKDTDNEEGETKEIHKSHKATKESESEMERTDFDESYEEKLEDEIDIDDTQQQAMPVIKLPTFFL